MPQCMHSDRQDHDRVEEVMKYPHSYPITSNEDVDSHSDQSSSSEQESSEGSDFDEWKDESDGSDSDSITSYDTIQEVKQKKSRIDEIEEVDIEELARMRYTSVQKLRTSWERIIRQYGNRRLQKGDKVDSAISQRNEHLSIPLPKHSRSWKPHHSVVPPIARFKGSAGFMIAPEWQILSSEEDEGENLSDAEEDEEDVIDFEAKDWEKKVQYSSYFGQSDECQRAFKASRVRTKPEQSTSISAKSKQTLLELKEVIDLTGATSDEDQYDNGCVRTKERRGEALQIEEPMIERTNEKDVRPSSISSKGSQTYYLGSIGNPERTESNALGFKENATNNDFTNQSDLQIEKIAKLFPPHFQKNNFSIEPESGSEDVHEESDLEYKECGDDDVEINFVSTSHLGNDLIEANYSPKQDYESLKTYKRKYMNLLNDREILSSSELNFDVSVPKQQRKKRRQARITAKIMKKSDEGLYRRPLTSNKVTNVDDQQNLFEIKQISKKKRLFKSDIRQPRQKIITNFMSSSKPNKHLSSSQCEGRNECTKSFCLICGSFKGLGTETLI